MEACCSWGGAYAQPQELKKDLGDFSLLPKNLTSNGVAKAYMVEGHKYYDDGNVTFNILDENLNTEKSFGRSLAEKSWTFTTSQWRYVVEVTKSDREKATFVKEDREPEKKENRDYAGYRKNPDTVYCGSMDEFKQIVRSGFYSFLGKDKDDSDFFIDHNGNWSILCRSGMSSDYWNGSISITNCSLKSEEDAQSPNPTIQTTFSEAYYFYNRTDSCMYSTKRTMEVEKQISDEDFVLRETNEYNSSSKEVLQKQKVSDADNGGGFRFDTYITQNLLNDDDKYEYLISREILEEQPATPQIKVWKPFDSYVDKTVTENNYKIVGTQIDAVNEDGEVLFHLDLPFENVYDTNVYVLNGKTYLEVYSASGSIIYLIDPKSPDGVKEVARTKSANAEKTYNAAGVQVAKDAKGLVVTDNGMKYINR